MAYSDYGGYAYRNGEKIIERSDAVLTTDGLKSSPGIWPGFVIPEGRGGGCYHVIAGDGPVHIGLFKQSSTYLFVDGKELNIADFVPELHKEAVREYDTGTYVDTDYFLNREIPLIFDIEGHKVELFYDYADNYYQHLRLTQPDGAVWIAWSGYGVGCGFDDGDYGFSSSNVESVSESLWANPQSP